ncbi:MAG: RDD family protein [Mycobacteriaceae bacterium]|nr:RDD family protein [Mycobacteriaceae bacterium]
MTVPVSSAHSLASWRSRACAIAVDALSGLVVVATMAVLALSVPSGGVLWWLSRLVGGAVILLILINRLLLPPLTGWTLGRALCGVRVQRGDGTATGAWRLLFRELAHVLDTVSALVGWLWPLWDSRRRTFADLLAGTEVRCVAPDERRVGIRRWVAIAMLTAAAVCVTGAAANYALVHSRDQAIDRARGQIGVAGPRIVAQMLTYDPKTLHDDFAHALSLTTDKYRGQLSAQQDAVQKGQPVINEYWVTASAIESVAPNDATMLLFMQGRRGAAPTERYITATVRVRFRKCRDNNWRVEDLTVLTKPKPSGAQK